MAMAAVSVGGLFSSKAVLSPTLPSKLGRFPVLVGDCRPQQPAAVRRLDQHFFTHRIEATCTRANRSGVVAHAAALVDEQAPTESLPNGGALDFNCEVPSDDESSVSVTAPCASGRLPSSSSDTAGAVRPPSYSRSQKCVHLAI